MTWKEMTPLSNRAAFIEQAKAEGANISALCRAYGISRKTGYKWLKRERESGAAGLVDHSRRPTHSPEQTPANIESQVLAVRKAHPDWGGRKIRRVLQDQGHIAVPAASTITAILGRHQQIDPAESLKHKPVQRFEREQPNELWQMDFKGYFALGGGGYCHPLTVLDDHSRYLVGLKACPDETYETVQRQLTAIFQQFGLPQGMLMDNGSPWGNDGGSHYTILTAWLVRLEIAVWHGRPYHPQTQGKDERLNRTLLTEVIQRHAMHDLIECQRVFDQWWHTYNDERPHDALQLDTPAAHYQPSPRPFPDVLPPITYDPQDLIRKVDQNGKIFFHNRAFRVGKAFRNQPVAVRPGLEDGLFDVFFCKQKVAKINLRVDNQC
jgi:transposase InsO family protein